MRGNILVFLVLEPTSRLEVEVEVEVPLVEVVLPVEAYMVELLAVCTAVCMAVCMAES